MAEKQVTTMVIKVDLDCAKCRKKIKKVLCKIPQIQNQTYDKKANTVTITVVCCCPEKIKKKICCKGGDSVQGIEIKVPEKPKPIKNGQETGKPVVEESKKTEKNTVDGSKPKPNPPEHPPAPVYRRTCCTECYWGYGGGPCYGGMGMAHVMPYGRPVYDCWCGGCGCGCRRAGYYVCRCDYVCYDNPSSCTTM